jgi:hypothetical protein
MLCSAMYPALFNIQCVAAIENRRVEFRASDGLLQETAGDQSKAGDYASGWRYHSLNNGGVDQSFISLHQVRKLGGGQCIEDGCERGTKVNRVRIALRLTQILPKGCLECNCIV